MHLELSLLAVSPHRQTTGRKLHAWDLMDLNGDVAQLVMQAGLSGPPPGSPSLQNDEGDTSHGDSVSRLAVCWTPRDGQSSAPLQ